MNKLSETKRNSYLRLAEQKINKDTQELLQFIKLKGLNPSIEEISARNEAEHIYNVAKKLWEHDGYIEEPSAFVRISEREAKFRDGLLKKELNDAKNNIP